jgi:Tn3 transposase DDE domain
VLWNTTYLERAVAALRAHGDPVDDTLLPHLSPLGWEHINLTGDYTWTEAGPTAPDKPRQLRLDHLPPRLQLAA